MRISRRQIRLGPHDIEMAVVTAMPESGDRVSKLEQPKQGVVMAVKDWNVPAHGSVHCQYQRLIDLHNSREAAED
jgi:hypothetical protein